MNLEEKAREILNGMKARKLSPEVAKKRLIEIGTHPAMADDMIYVAQGRSDVVIVDENYRSPEE